MNARYLVIAVVLAMATQTQAQEAIDSVVVIGSTPLGKGMDADDFASNVQVATSEEIQEQHALDLAEFMNRNLGSVFVNEALGNPLQPDIQYRGYVGSPLLGMPQGIAVYQDGVRVNEPFGDTVNWSLIPESAIDLLYLMPGSNPLFGLNALGGSISIETKDGFSHPGTSAEAYLGSFSRVSLQAETGDSFDDRFAYFVTGSYLQEDGWRDFSPTEAIQAFASVAWRSAQTAVDASLTVVDTNLAGNGAVPVQLLQFNREAIFTHPDRTNNDLALLSLKFSHDVSNFLAVNGNIYRRDSDISTFNGDVSEFVECTNMVGILCEGGSSEEELALDPNGNPIPFTSRLQAATINRTTTEQDGAGLSIQVSLSKQLAGRDNLTILGLVYDASDTRFVSSTELGSLDETRQAVPSGIFIGDAFTRLNAHTSNVGFYFSDTFSFADKATLTISGRYNQSVVTLRDQLGSALNGDHEFSRFNPAIGITVGILDGTTIYAGYSESNRVPSPVELTCADPDDPCRLPNAFLADPPLADVVAGTFEAGIRGNWRKISWHVGMFRATNEDDILFVSAGAGTNQGFFDNVGRTRRDGVELNMRGDISERVSWFANYTVLDVTFSSSFVIPSPNNPRAVDGEIFIKSGDRLPLIPEYSFKSGVQLSLHPKFSVGANLLMNSGAYFRGDESNLIDQLDSYTVLNIRGDYSISDVMEVFVKIDNVFGEDYETFGMFGEADEVLGDAFEDSRFLSPAAPLAAWIGVRASF